MPNRFVSLSLTVFSSIFKAKKNFKVFFFFISLFIIFIILKKNLIIKKIYGALAILFIRSKPFFLF